MSSQTNDENKLDFDILKRQLAASNFFQMPDLSSGSSSGSTSSRPETIHSEIWPLQLSTISVGRYILGDTIGSGSYAEVRECVDTQTLQRCAVKIVDKHYLSRQAPNALRNQLQEIRLLRRLKCENIISMKECLFKRTKIYIFLEHCSFVLNDLLDEQPEGRLCVQLCKNLFKQLIAGLDYLHSLGIVHRDIKPQNLLIANCGTLKIIDFGVSQTLSLWSQNDLCSNYEGSPLFQAPEVVSGCHTDYAGFKVDIWSSGVTLYLMLFGRYPFDDEALLGLYDKILSQELSFPLDKVKIEQQTVAIDLLSSMLEKESSKRTSIEDIQKHPWLNWQIHLNIDQPACFDLLFASAKSSKTLAKGDIYRSMSVLPYLHNYHFPKLPVMKVKPPSPLSSLVNSRANSPANVSTRSDKTETFFEEPISGHSTGKPDSASQTASINPHEVIDDNPIEWGTERQYKLLKVPQIRTNRMRKSYRRKTGTNPR